MMVDLFAATLADQIAEVKHEIAMRGRVYPRLVAAGKMKQEDANRKCEVMAAVLNTLVAIKGGRDV